MDEPFSGRRPMHLACRFAPSPNGALHLGHAYSVIRNEHVADRLGAALHLRLEDLDAARCTPSLEAAVLDDLRWLGAAWSGVPLRQAGRAPVYEAALEDLASRDLLYPCFCTRGGVARTVDAKGSWPRDPDGSPLYPGTCRRSDPRLRAARVAAGEPHSLRLDVGKALAAASADLGWTEYRDGARGLRVPAEPACWGDAVLRRRDAIASYHLAVVVDDAAQGISDVVRGEDLFAATALHRLLQALLRLPEPRYHHHRLVRDETGLKLAKSSRSTGLAALRLRGVSPVQLRRDLERMMDRPDPHGSSIVSQ